MLNTVLSTKIILLSAKQVNYLSLQSVNLFYNPTSCTYNTNMLKANNVTVYLQTQVLQKQSLFIGRVWLVILELALFQVARRWLPIFGGAETALLIHFQ